MWLKYSSGPIMTGEQWDRKQPEPMKYEKPCGFWLTDDSEDCWRSWCVGEGFALEGLTHKHEVVLDESNILIMRSAYELDAFTRQFKTERSWCFENRQYTDICIDWRAVAERYDGLIITPYQWSQRMALSWYYGWDCASGCIWKAAAIREVRLMAVDHEIAKPREAEAA